jgi:ABC-type uncharacterized transport system substrate-binding protein
LSVAALRRLDRTVPIVFFGVTDPLGAGFVDDLARRIAPNYIQATNTR